jgi:hypothetical protein
MKDTAPKAILTLLGVRFAQPAAQHLQPALEQPNNG